MHGRGMNLIFRRGDLLVKYLSSYVLYVERAIGILEVVFQKITVNSLFKILLHLRIADRAASISNAGACVPDICVPGPSR